MSDKYTNANQSAWEEVAPIHSKLKFDDLCNNFQTPEYTFLSPITLNGLQEIGLHGKDVVQLCCNNGRELISVKRLGADRCVGIDFSNAFIEQARRLASIGKMECSFATGDIMEIDPAQYSPFDIVMTTEGTLRWIHDLATFFSICRKLLKDDGWVSIVDMHPILNMYGTQLGNKEATLRHSYFENGPFKEDSGLDYFTGKQYDATSHYWYQHNLGDIVSSCVGAGFKIHTLVEYPYNLIHRLGILNQRDILYPMSFRLLAKI